MNASLDEKLKSVKWGEFKLGNLFQFKGIKQSKSQKDIPFDEKGIPYIVQSSTNNMCGRYVNKQYLLDTNEPPVKGNAIVLGVTLPAVSYQPKEFGASQVIEARADFLNEKNGLFFAISISKQMHRFSYQNKPGIEIYKNLTIQLPIRQPHEIDFDFMESFISELEQERINKLNAYLEASGLKDYELTEEEEKILKDSERWIWKEYSVMDIFDVNNTHNILSSDIMPNSGKTPYLCASSENNGVNTYISYKKDLIEKGNCIFIGGKTFVVSFQKDDFYSNDSHNLALYLKKQNATAKNQLFLVSCVNKGMKHKYSWGNSISGSKIRKDTFRLPTQNSIPDYKSMETFIRAIEKLVIKDVVLYTERKIAATKEVTFDQPSSQTLAAELSEM